MAPRSRSPVLVGVGVANAPGDVVELMVAAARAAADDAGAPSLLAAIGQVATPKGTWPHTDPARAVARRIGAPEARTVLAELGVPQQTLVGDALARVRDGELGVALVVGGEARRSAPDAAAPDDAAGDPDVRLTPTGELVAPPEVAAKVWQPVQQYALIDSALRHAEGRTLDEHRDDVARLWARFNEVARSNPHAAFPTPRDATALRRLDATNRPLAFPYGKWHSTQWTVDQAAALIVCSAEAARDHRVPPDRWVFPAVALESSFALSLSRRADVHRWPAMAVLGAAAARHLGRPLDDVELVELYSCFPSAVRVQQRELRLSADRVPTLTGGMAFAGGPFNNFTYQATAAVVGALRAGGGLGLVSTVSGLLTKPGLMVWSADPPSEPLLVADLADDARAATPAREVVDAHTGEARVVAATATYDGATPSRLVTIVEVPDGRRTVATSDDPALAARATAEEVVGTTVAVEGTTVVG